MKKKFAKKLLNIIEHYIDQAVNGLVKQKLVF